MLNTYHAKFQVFMSMGSVINWAKISYFDGELIGWHTSHTVDVKYSGPKVSEQSNGGQVFMIFIGFIKAEKDRDDSW